MKKEREALYLGGHKIGYRAIKGTERGVLYKKNDEEMFQSCTSFIQDMLTGPCIVVKQEKEYAK